MPNGPETGMRLDERVHVLMTTKECLVKQVISLNASTVFILKKCSQSGTTEIHEGKASTVKQPQSNSHYVFAPVILEITQNYWSILFTPLVITFRASVLLSGGDVSLPWQKSNLLTSKKVIH